MHVLNRVQCVGELKNKTSVALSISLSSKPKRLTALWAKAECTGGTAASRLFVLSLWHIDIYLRPREDLMGRVGRRHFAVTANKPLCVQHVCVWIYWSFKIHTENRIRISCALPNNVHVINISKCKQTNKQTRNEGRPFLTETNIQAWLNCSSLSRLETAVPVPLLCHHTLFQACRQTASKRKAIKSPLALWFKSTHPCT